MPDYSEIEGWEACAGYKMDKEKFAYILYMCGGCAEWYNYIINHTTGAVYKENAFGRKQLRDAVVYSNEDADYIMIGGEDYEMREGEICLSELVCSELEWDD